MWRGVMAGLVAMAVPAGLDAGSATPLPARIEPAGFGAPSFDEGFAALDAGADQIRPAHPHRWRTVHGYGGADALSNRQLSAMSLAVDARFDGTDHGESLGLDPFAITPDGLTITARKVSPELAARMFGHGWASGLLTTKFSFSQLHGYFEAEMDLPACEKGAWPAFWLLPVNGQWPVHGEIDAPETIGGGEVWWSTVASVAGKRVTTHQRTPADCARGWHRYGVLWRADRVGFYYDRKLVGEEATPADWTEPMFLLLDLAVGGSWPGPPDAGVSEISMRVRRVMAWKDRK